MTQNQLNYWANKERARANRAQETQKENELKQKAKEFSQSNWYKAIASIGSGVGNIMRGTPGVLGLFTSAKNAGKGAIQNAKNTRSPRTTLF